MNAGRRVIEPEDIPGDIADRLGRVQHRRECGAFDGGTANRWFPPPYPYEAHHREVDMRRAAIRLAEALTILCVPVDEFDVIVDRRLW